MPSNTETWDYSPFWNEALSQIKDQISEHDFTVWFNIEYVSSEKEKVIIATPSQFYQDQFKKKYLSLLESTLHEMTGMAIKVDFVIAPGKKRDNVQQDQPQAAVSKSESAERSPEPMQNSSHPIPRDIKLKPEYTFDSFVIGENNSFAATAAMAIAKNPGVTYNPYFIYGGVGLGKTHLMQAIGNSIHDSNRKLKIKCITAEDFLNEFIQAIGDDKRIPFKNKYRNVDVLLIDDIHFLQDKKALQEELFYTFNALYDAKKQMVFTCDRPASELRNLNERLQSRLEMGLTVDLSPPNYETRLAILKKKTEARNLSIPDEVLDIIAKNITSNVRDLEGALSTLFAYSELVKKEITIPDAQKTLKDLFTKIKQGNISFDIILKVVASYFNLSLVDLKGKKKTKAISVPRQIAMYIAREMTELSTTEIGMELGGRDHTTIMHGYQKIEEQIKMDPGFYTRVQSLIKEIKDSCIKL